MSVTDPVGLYRAAPRASRLHVRTRWRSAPLAAVAAEVPPAGRVLDLGCGHALLALHLAASSPDRRVTGVDVDTDKLAVGRDAARAGNLDVTLLEGSAVDVPPGPWDAVTVVDVLYLLPADLQQALIHSAASALTPGGVLVVKEMSRRPRWKFAWNRLQELLAVRVLRITAGHDLTFAPDGALAAWMADAGLDVIADRPLDRGYLHPHYLLVGRRPDA